MALLLAVGFAPSACLAGQQIPNGLAVTASRTCISADGQCVIRVTATPTLNGNPAPRAGMSAQMSVPSPATIVTSDSTTGSAGIAKCDVASTYGCRVAVSVTLSDAAVTLTGQSPVLQFAQGSYVLTATYDSDGSYKFHKSAYGAWSFNTYGATMSNDSDPDEYAYDHSGDLAWPLIEDYIPSATVQAIAKARARLNESEISEASSALHLTVDPSWSMEWVSLGEYSAPVGWFVEQAVLLDAQTTRFLRDSATSSGESKANAWCDIGVASAASGPFGDEAVWNPRDFVLHPVPQPTPIQTHMTADTNTTVSTNDTQGVTPGLAPPYDEDPTAHGTAFAGSSLDPILWHVHVAG